MSLPREISCSLDPGGINKIVLNLLRPNTDRSWVESLHRLSGTDWEGIFRLSLRHCIAPLLYHRLITHFGKVDVPDEVMGRLRHASLYFTAKNIHSYHEFERLLKNLGDSTPLLLLKGGHLAAFVYNDVSLRSMVDMDILVRKADMNVVAEAMKELGYTRNLENPNHSYHVSYLDSSRTVNFEVHWNICSETAHPSIPDVEELWRASRTEKFKGNEIRVLSPEHLLLHICLHDASQHLFLCGLRTFCDIDAIIRCYGDKIDWKVVVSRSRHWGITKSSYITLLLAREMMDANVPEKVLAALKPMDFRSQNTSWARKAIFAPLSQDEPVSDKMAEFWGSDRYKHKVAVLFENLFPPRDHMARTYSVPSDALHILLYYPWRLIKLWMRYGRSLRRMWNPHSEAHTGLEAEHSRNLLRKWLESI